MKTLTTKRNGQTALRTNWSVPSVDQIMAEERATAFARRSIKTSAKLAGLKLAVSMTDLTTLKGKDTPGKIAFLCRKAMQALHPRYEVPSCAAVCVYPNLVRFAKKFQALAPSGGVAELVLVWRLQSARYRKIQDTDRKRPCQPSNNLSPADPRQVQRACRRADGTEGDCQ